MSTHTQHGTNNENELAELGEYMRLIELQPGEILYEDQCLDRGLFFIEDGLMVSAERT